MFRNVLAFSMSVAVAVSAAADRPNVIVIMADDVGYECFGCYGSDQYRTPRIDDLAAQGVRFTEAHSQPLCTPSRVKLMTGRSNADNYVAFSILDPKLKTIGQHFQDAGYRTAVAGKWQLLGSEGYAERFKFRGSWPERCGFDQHCLWQVDKRGLRYWDPLLRVNGVNTQYEGDDYGPDVVSKFVRDFISSSTDSAGQEKPFFIYYPMILVHDPFLPTPDSDPSRPRKKQRGFKQENFEDMVAYMDRLIGELVDHLKAESVDDNTLLLFMGDNGTNKAITSVLKDRTIIGGKGLTKDRGTHVPLIASWPAKHATGTTVADLIDFTDILPTALDAAGQDAPSDCQGVSFLPQIRGESGTPREFAYCYYWPRPERGEPQRFVHDGKWKLYADGRLFHVDADIEESAPVDGHEDVRTRLTAALNSVTDEGKAILRLGPQRRTP